MRPDMIEVLEAVSAALERVKEWTVEPGPVEDPTSKAAKGATDEWKFLVVDYALPNGRRGVDGTATHSKRLMVVRLTPELARRAWDAAAKATPLEEYYREVAAPSKTDRDASLPGAYRLPPCGCAVAGTGHLQHPFRIVFCERHKSIR